MKGAPLWINPRLSLLNALVIGLAVAWSMCLLATSASSQFLDEQSSQEEIAAAGACFDFGDGSRDCNLMRLGFNMGLLFLPNEPSTQFFQQASPDGPGELAFSSPSSITVVRPVGDLASASDPSVPSQPLVTPIEPMATSILPSYLDLSPVAQCARIVAQPQPDRFYLELFEPPISPPGIIIDTWTMIDIAQWLQNRGVLDNDQVAQQMLQIGEGKFVRLLHNRHRWFDLHWQDQRLATRVLSREHLHALDLPPSAVSLAMHYLALMNDQ